MERAAVYIDKIRIKVDIKESIYLWTRKIKLKIHIYIFDHCHIQCPSETNSRFRFLFFFRFDSCLAYQKIFPQIRFAPSLIRARSIKSLAEL